MELSPCADRLIEVLAFVLPSRRLQAGTPVRSDCACLGLLGRNGVACLLGLDARRRDVELDGRVLGVDAIVENRTVFGSVNAHRTDWLAAVESLERAHERWPDALHEFVSLRVPLDRFAEAFDHPGVKATLVLGD